MSIYNFFVFLSGILGSTVFEQELSEVAGGNSRAHGGRSRQKTVLPRVPVRKQKC